MKMFTDQVFTNDPELRKAVMNLFKTITDRMNDKSVLSDTVSKLYQ